ncbi:MAG: NAD-dependent epimerase/dehydratase family protein [Novipirellula sp. JB048]
MAHALVTGATGFIGAHLVRELTRSGKEVTCLVREHSDRSQLEASRPRFAIGDISDRDSIRRALDGVDVVYHLAGVTKSLRASDYTKINELGVANVSACCRQTDSAPTLVVVSSLAAVGPSAGDRPHRESDTPQPVSDYGRSKLAGERAARRFAADVPTTIVRPPIVLGQGDLNGLEMFKTIARFGFHLVPGWGKDRVSVIHAEDLAKALILASTQGARLTPQGDDAEGVYFATDEENPTYAELGRMIGRTLGRYHAWVIRSPKSAVWAIAAFNELASQIVRRPHILNLDKAREATAGSWTCTAAALNRDTGFAPAYSLQQRLAQTTRWYLQQGWLQAPRQLQPALKKRHPTAS